VAMETSHTPMFSGNPDTRIPVACK
jgi:hypothetical protein